MNRCFKHNILHRVKRRIDDKDINVSLIATSIVVNSIMAFFKMIFGFYVESLWLVLHAVYFFILALTRYRVMRYYIYAKTIKNPIQRYDMEFDVHNRHGGIIFLLGITYFALCLRMYFVGDVVLIGGFLVYWFIVFAVIKNVFAIYGIVVTRSKKTPIVRVMKVIGTVDALLSIVPVIYTSCSYFELADSAAVASFVGILISISVMTGGIIMANRSKDKYMENYIAALADKE